MNSGAYREPPARDASTGECLWRRSSRDSILAVVFGVAAALVGVLLYVNDPKNAAPPLFLLGGFSGVALFVWTFSSRNAVVAMSDRGLRVGWLGGPTRFVPWEEVTRVEDQVRRRVILSSPKPLISNVLRVHCRGQVHSIHDRLVGRTSFQAARRVLRAHVRPECFDESAIGFDPPPRAVLALATAPFALGGLVTLVVTVGLARNTWIAYRGWRQWPHVTATVIRNGFPPGSKYRRAVLQYDVNGGRFTRTIPGFTSSGIVDVGTRVEQAVDPQDPSRAVTLRELTVDFKNLAASLACCALFGAVLMAVLRARARRRQERQAP
jgi:hypothetical protein